MKITRTLTEEEYDKLLELSKKPELQSDNKYYYHCEHDNLKEDEEVKYIKNLLKEIIVGFSSFSNFRASNTNILRIQFNWNYETHNPTYVGIGYISLKELKEGFEPQKEGGPSDD